MQHSTNKYVFRVLIALYQYNLYLRAIACFSLYYAFAGDFIFNSFEDENIGEKKKDM